MDRASDDREATRRSVRASQPRRDSPKIPLLGLLLAVAALLLLGVGSAAAYQLTHGDEVYPGVSVGDVQLGGMTKEAALAKLRPWLGQRTSQPMVVRGPDTKKEMTPADLGASFDAAAAVESAFAVGRTGGIFDKLSAQLGALTEGHRVDAPGLRIDRAKLTASVAQWAAEIDRPVMDSDLKVTADLKVTVSPSVVGRWLDQPAAVLTLERALATGSGSVDLPVVETKPKVTQQDVEDGRLRVTKMLSGPVSLEFGGHQWTVSVKEIASAVTIGQNAGVPAPVVSFNDDLLQKQVEKAGNEVDQPKVNARFDWNGGNLKLLREGQDGLKVDRAKALALLTSAVSADQRTVALPVDVDKAAGNNVDSSKLGIKELIESASTTFYGSVPEKAHNIQLAASRLNGVLVAPGEIFSFNHELGPTTLKSGFQIGFGIAITNGEMQTVPSVAGGICQVATTLFHTFFNAGYQLEERYPHAYWIQSYGQPPKGRVGLDATVDEPKLDLKFMNNTDDYLLIQANVHDSTVGFSFYGTKPKWKVEIDPSVITNVVKPDTATVRQEEPTWAAGRELWVERATDGMDVTITRRVIQGGEVRTLNLKSHYAPAGNVLMVGSAPPPPMAIPKAGATSAPATAQPTSAVGTAQPATPPSTAQPTTAPATAQPTAAAKPTTVPTPKPAPSPTPQNH